MKLRWSLRQMFWWMFVLALILPYFVRLMPHRINPLTQFSVSRTDLLSWLHELDPTTRIIAHGDSARGSADSTESESDYVVAMDNATTPAAFSHLRKRIEEKIKKGSWKVTWSGRSRRSFSFVFSIGFSRYRLYVWNVPPSEEDRAATKHFGRHTLRLKVVLIGYTR